MAGWSKGVSVVWVRKALRLPRRPGRDGSVRVVLRAFLLVFAFALTLTSMTLPARTAGAVKGDVSATIDQGFGRFLFTLAEEVESQVRFANGILVITFKRPVDINVDKLAANSQGYISAARRDPDGKAIRIALARKLTMNSMAVAERLFIDLLPDTWTDLPPGLPREVIEEIARRAREAERKVRQQRTLVRQSKMAAVRVRVAIQPTFVRYVFELPELISVTTNNSKDRLTLVFDSVLKFDLADANAALPAAIGVIESELEQDTVSVRFVFTDKVDVRTFREDLSYIVDVTSVADAKNVRGDGSVRSDELNQLAAQAAAARAGPPANVEAPQTVPARPSPSAPAAPVPERTQPPAETAPVVVQPSSKPQQVSEPAVRSEPPPAAAPPAVTPPAPAAAKPRTAAGKQSPPGSGDLPVDVTLKRQGDNLSLSFPFGRVTPAAMFLRGDTLWLVFDTDAIIGLNALESEPSRSIKSATLVRQDHLSILRMKLERPLLISAVADGPVWTVNIGAEVLDPTRPLGISRNIVGTARSSITIPFDDPRQTHRIGDPDAGDTLLVITAPGPARGFVKTQDFVEFRALVSVHGVIVQQLADDLNAELAVDKIVITRPPGLSLSGAVGGGPRSASTVYQRHVLDAQMWTFDRKADFSERKAQLIHAAADAKDAKRFIARLDLARFYLARDMAAEAKAVLDVAIADHPPTPEDPTALVMRAAANILIGRPEQALRDLASPFVGNQWDAPLWRALASARQGKWSDAREGFRNVGMTMGTLPVELQRLILKEMMRASIEVGDITGAINQMHEFETIGVTRELEPALAVLSGRLAEARGRVDDALNDYQTAADSWDRPMAAQGRLREVLLRLSLGTLSRPDAIGELETLTTIWRGDETELEALALLARVYTEEGRYRDAFQIMRATNAAHPHSLITRRVHAEAAESFEALFLGGKADALSAIEALGLFYDFRELTPIGRRGDEMIRRLADRLVAIDLLDQGAELLQHQIDHRLQGAARAQVATKLAVVYLSNRKPDRALATLRASRTAELNNELRTQRLLIEARALSELGRHDLALEVIARIEGREASRLRADVLWAAKRWREAGEQIELLYGERWQQFEPLTAPERTDILRAGIAFALAEDSIGLARFRDKYAGKIGEGVDRRAFDVVTAPIGTSGPEFRDVARAVSLVDTLDGFLSDMRTRYPESSGVPVHQRTPVLPGQPPNAVQGTTGAAANAAAAPSRNAAR
jgi:tetratricopeptide (TPR) repeat protein